MWEIPEFNPKMAYKKLATLKISISKHPRGYQLYLYRLLYMYSRWIKGTRGYTLKIPISKHPRDIKPWLPTLLMLSHVYILIGLKEFVGATRIQPKDVIREVGNP